MREEMITVSMAIAGKTLFNVDLKQEAPEIHQALEYVTSLFGRITMPFSELLLKLPIPSTFRFNKAKKRLDETIYRMIDNRRQSKEDIGDLLSLLLRAQKEDLGG
jgi:cytochrome P450